MIRNWYSVAGIGVLIIGTVLFFQLSNNSVTERISLSAQEVGTQTNTTVTISDMNIPVEVASTFEQKSRGLSYRESLNKNTGMLFVFDSAQPVSFWMYEMKFPLDIIWISNGKIIGIERNVPYPVNDAKPEDLPTYSPPGKIDLVLEVNVGEADRFSVGDKITITETEAI